MRFVDSHSHLSEREASSALALGAGAQTLIVTCGVDRRTSEEGARLARVRPEALEAFVGVHPSEAKRSRGLGWLGRALQASTGLGEVGLDPAYSSVGPKGAQMRVFLGQLELAERAAKPVQVHSRGAEMETVDLLAGFRVPRVLMHWLESEDALPIALEKGYFVSFSPAVLYSKKLQRMAAKAPADQVLTESDSPVTYRPLGEAHGPSLVPSVVFKLSEIWGMSFEDSRAAVLANAKRFLGIGEKG